MRIRACLIALICHTWCAAAILAQDVFVIRNARLVTVSGSTIEKGSVVIQHGRIAEVGERVKMPPKAVVIEAQGMTVYPGLFDADTNLGLTEIGQVAATNDYAEMGSYMPHLLAFSAFHVESEMIPVTRAAGVTHVLSRPRGGVVAGQAAVMSLAGWIPEEMEIRRRGALLINFPSQPGFQTRSFEPAPAARRPLAELRKEYEAAVRELGLFFDKGRHYLESKSKAPAEIQPDQRLDALLPALQGEEPVLISAQNHVDIKAAVEFAEKQKLNFVLLSANDAWRVADFLKEHRVRVILGPCQELPRRDDDPIDIVYRLPSILHAKGIPFAITSGTASDSRNLPHEAGNAVAYGLPREAALRAITLTPAELLGVADEVGSIDKGKRANLVVADGDIFEYQTRVKHLFINGRPVDLETKHSKLYEKYASRP